jgi:hypothetical protein
MRKRELDDQDEVAKTKRLRSDSEIGAFYALGPAGWNEALDTTDDTKTEEERFPCRIVAEYDENRTWKIPIMINVCGGGAVFHRLVCWSRIRHSGVLARMLSPQFRGFSEFLATVSATNNIPILTITVTSGERETERASALSSLIEVTEDAAKPVKDLSSMSTKRIIELLALADEYGL